MTARRRRLKPAKRCKRSSGKRRKDRGWWRKRRKSNREGIWISSTHLNILRSYSMEAKLDRKQLKLQRNWLLKTLGKTLRQFKKLVSKLMEMRSCHMKMPAPRKHSRSKSEVKSLKESTSTQSSRAARTKPITPLDFHPPQEKVKGRGRTSATTNWTRGLLTQRMKIQFWMMALLVINWRKLTRRRVQQALSTTACLTSSRPLSSTNTPISSTDHSTRAIQCMTKSNLNTPLLACLSSSSKLEITLRTLMISLINLEPW